MADTQKISWLERVFRRVEEWAYDVCSALTEPFAFHWTEKRKAAFQQFVRFAIVGTFNTAFSMLFSMGTVWLCNEAGWNGDLGPWTNMDTHLGTLMGFLACCINSYYFNSRFTFHVTERKTFPQHLAGLFKVMVSYSFAVLLLGWALNMLWSTFHMNKYLGLVLNAIISTPFNFLLNKYWTYRKKK